MRTKARFAAYITYANGEQKGYNYLYLSNAISNIINEDKIRPIAGADIIDLTTGVLVAQYKGEVLANV